jgi:uncharacterized zinc-type alcohol dehydrogenase-like protein
LFCTLIEGNRNAYAEALHTLLSESVEYRPISDAILRPEFQTAQPRPDQFVAGRHTTLCCSHPFSRGSHAYEGLRRPVAVAPLLCAGITTWSPLRHWKIGPGMKVGVVGIGGLGHMGIKLAHALGAHVVAFTTSESKREAALSLGADEVVVSTDKTQMNAHAASFNFILNTVAAPHNLDAFMTLLTLDGTMTVVGVPGSPHPSPATAPFIFKRRSLAGSLIGGIAETQEMLDFCAKHNITADIEMIQMQDIEAAFKRMTQSDVRYRFVVDMASLKAA